MFDSMYFEKQVKVDKNSRILLPRETGVQKGAKLVIADLDYYYGIYLLERIDALVDRLSNEKITASSKRRAEILNDLNFIFGAVKRISVVDCQKRILLPNNFVEQKITLQGRKDYLALFDNDALAKFKEDTKNSTILR